MLNKKKCKYCLETRDYIRSEIRRTTGTIVYIDKGNKQWRGAKCPNCYSKETISSRQTPKKTKRKCNVCNLALPSTRHFNCEDCLPYESDIDDTFTYPDHSIH